MTRRTDDRASKGEDLHLNPAKVSCSSQGFDGFSNPSTVSPQTNPYSALSNARSPAHPSACPPACPQTLTYHVEVDAPAADGDAALQLVRFAIVLPLAVGLADGHDTLPAAAARLAHAEGPAQKVGDHARGEEALKENLPARRRHLERERAKTKQNCKSGQACGRQKDG